VVVGGYKNLQINNTNKERSFDAVSGKAVEDIH